MSRLTRTICMGLVAAWAIWALLDARAGLYGYAVLDIVVLLVVLAAALTLKRRHR